MAAHHREIIDSIPSRRPLGQGFWLFATLVLAIIILTSMGDNLQVRSASAAEQPPPVTTSAPAARQPLQVDLGTVAAPVTFDQAATAGLTESERRGRAALTLIDYRWQELLPEWSIDFLDAKEGLYGLTLVPEKRIEIYVRPEQSETLLAHVIAHELGHAVDVTFNDGGERRRWEEARDLDGAPWWPGSGATDFSTGAGDFAEAFAAWQVGDESFRSTLADPPTAEHLALIAELARG